MLSRFLITAVSVALCIGFAADAQSVRALGGPRNFPPAGFTGQQFVDNAGCVFLKAGFGGQTNWVPRISANRKPLCGFPPTFGAAVAAAVEADMQPDPMAAAPVVAAVPAAPRPAAAPVVAPVIAAVPLAPRPVVAPIAVAPVVAEVAAPVIQPAPMAPRRGLMSMLFGAPRVGNPIPLVPTAPAPVVAQIAAPAAPPAAARPAYVTAATAGQGQCVPGSPVLETVLLRSGGTALVCTRGDGTLDGWRAPLFPQGVIGGGLTPHMMQGARLYSAAAAGGVTASTAVPTPPRGYKLAWKDDRLNPMRGIGTASGQAQQDQVWTRDVPAQQVVAAPVVAQQPQARVAVSTMSAPASQPLPAARAASLVQIGTFGQPANADGVRARLAALGLPVSTSQITRKGKVLQIVYAGPFATTAQAQAALAAARNAGYGDAILK